MLLSFLSVSPLPVWYLTRLAFAGKQSLRSATLSHGQHDIREWILLNPAKVPSHPDAGESAAEMR